MQLCITNIHFKRINTFYLSESEENTLKAYQITINNEIIKTLKTKLMFEKV